MPSDRLTTTLAITDYRRHLHRARTAFAVARAHVIAQAAASPRRAARFLLHHTSLIVHLPRRADARAGDACALLRDTVRQVDDLRRDGDPVVADDLLLRPPTVSLEHL